MRRYLLFWITACLLFPLTGNGSRASAQIAEIPLENERNPYIYYYSDLEHAFVVERADGSDSRLLAQNVMPEDHDVIDSVHWSPTGKYLAWRSHRFNGPGAYEVSGWLVSSDGTRVSHLLDDAADVFLVEWAPDKDWLAIGFYTDYPESADVIRLIDVPNNVIRAEMKVSYHLDRGYYFGMPRVWSEDSSVAFFASGGSAGTLVTRLTMDGRSEIRIFDENDPLIDYRRGRLMTREYERRDDTSRYNWIISDLSTGERHTFASYPLGEEPVNLDYDLHWNPDRSYAIVSEKRCDDRRRQCDIVATHLLRWSDGSQHVVPEGFSIARTGSPPGGTLWSPNGQIVMLQDTDDTFHLLDVFNYEIHSLNPAQFNNWKWLPNNDLLLTVIAGVDNDFYLYDWEKHTASRRSFDSSPQVYIGIYGVDISLSGTWVGLLGTEDVIIENLETGHRHEYPRHSRTTHGGPVNGYKWGESDEWFFSGGNTQIAAACCNNIAIMLHNLNEPSGRELTLCYGVYTCAGFLPEQVLPHLPEGQGTSHTPAPIHTLIHEADVVAVDWNADGTKLATYSTIRANSGYEGSIISIWDMAGPTPVLEQELSTDLICNDRPCRIIWEDSNSIRIVGSQHSDRIWRDFTEVLYLDGSTDNRVQAQRNNHSIVTPDGNFELIESEGDDGERFARLVDTTTGIPLSEEPLQDFGIGIIHQIDYGVQTGLLVASSVFGRGAIWYVATGERLSITNWTGYGAVFNPDGSRLAVAGSKFVTIWDMSPLIALTH